MSNNETEKASAAPQPDEAVCTCGWKFGRIIRVRWRDRWRDVLVLYGTGVRVYGMEVECPVCHKLFFHRG